MQDLTHRSSTAAMLEDVDPEADAEPAEVRQDAHPLPSVHRTIRVFILDDHELVRKGMRDLLTEAGGFDVVGESGSAPEAIRRIPALRPQVALLDVRLPDGSGLDVCREVRSRDQSIKVLMITSFDDEQAMVTAAVAGASGYLLKQIRGGDLVGAVRRVAAGESLLDPREVEAASRRLRAPRPTDPRISALTGQERRILDLIMDGLTNRQIGERLHIAEKTVKNHVTNVLIKLGFERRTQAAVFRARIRDDR